MAYPPAASASSSRVTETEFHLFEHSLGFRVRLLKDSCRAIILWSRACWALSSEASKPTKIVRSVTHPHVHPQPNNGPISQRPRECGRGGGGRKSIDPCWAP